MGPSRPDSVAILEYKFEKMSSWDVFLGFACCFFLKSQQKSGFLIKTGWILTKTIIMESN